MPVQELEYAYAYPYESAVVDVEGGRRLALATSGASGDVAFFRGSILSPKRTADLLLVVATVAQTRFYTPPAMLASILAKADPVITCGPEQMRFESFSACCSAHARLDLLPNAVYGDRFASGTTNVDINAPLRKSLSRLRDGDTLHLAVGSDGLTVHRAGDALVERKVKLPARWLRGFLEVQELQSRMSCRFELSAAEFRQFLRDLPRGMKGTVRLTRAARGLRITSVAASDAIEAGGLERLRVFEPVARHADRIRVYAADGGGTAWEMQTPDARLFLILSSDVHRGISGEGHALEALPASAGTPALGAVRAALHWQGRIDPDAVAEEAGVDRASVDQALAQCAALGLVGYDLAESSYFHRELPFDIAKIQRLQPRLDGARKLAEAEAVSIESAADPIRAWVRSGDVEYRVTLAGDEIRCSCPWFAKHGTERGLCKHVLAVRMAVGGNSHHD